MRQLGFDRSLHRIVTFAVHCSHLEAYILRSKNLLFINCFAHVHDLILRSTNGKNVKEIG